MILQSSIRSYFARKNIKEQLREKFEKEKENLIKSDIFKAVKWICFFYEDGLDTDARRLVSLSTNQFILFIIKSFHC